MKVKPIENTVGLKLNNFYFVYELRTENDIYGKRKNTMLIENDSCQLLPYKMDDFIVIEDNDRSTWIEVETKSGIVRNTYSELSGAHFWQDFYNDDDKCISAFIKVKKQIFSKLSNDEKNLIIESKNENDVILLLVTLSEIGDSSLVGTSISLADDMLKENYTKNDLMLKYMFEYLSTFRLKEVEVFFTSYYEHVELGTDELTLIVNSYFSS